MTSEKVSQLQLVQQNLQSVLAQKQQLEMQIQGLDSAIQEISDTPKVFKIIGKIMVSASGEKLKRELSEKKEFISLRLKNFINQEEKLTRTIEDLQKEVVEEMNKPQK